MKKQPVKDLPGPIRIQYRLYAFFVLASCVWKLFTPIKQCSSFCRQHISLMSYCFYDSAFKTYNIITIM